MLHNKNLNILTILFCTSLISSATINSHDTHTYTMRTPVVNNPKRDRESRPSYELGTNICCSYDGENLHIIFETSEGNFTLTITDMTNSQNETYSCHPDSLTSVFNIGHISNPILIEITTDAGNYYSYIINDEMINDN